VSWPLASLLVVALAVGLGFVWYERSHPPAKVLSLVAALAALATVGRIAFAAFPNVKPTTDIALLAGYTLGPAPGFAVGAVAALVSNFFFGQGPWTPWQMAAWGLTGVAGALLAAAAGRNLGRVPLAAACALAGLVFGAIMDLFTLLQTGTPSVGRYLAISATSVPFNVAHATGNLVFCLVAGPSFVRTLDRCRRRFEVRWVAVGAATAVALACVLAAPARAPASALGDGVAYLRGAQNADGGFGAAAGQPSSQLYTGWAVLGLRGAGSDPQSVRRGGRSPIDYMREHAGAITDLGSIERSALALEAVGLSPTSFAGRDLIGALMARRSGDGSFGGTVNLTVFAVLAAAPVHQPGLDASARWIERQQNSDGGFGFAPGATSDIDDTGGALEALTAAGLRGDAAEQRAVRFLEANQNGDGGFGQQPGESSNVQSAAWAVQGLVAAGVDPASASRGGRDAIGYIESLVERNGSIRYSSGTAQTPVWVTSQALDALARAPLPLGFVPTVAHSGSTSAAQAAAAATARTKARQRAAARRRARRRHTTTEGASAAGVPDAPFTVAPSTRSAARVHGSGGLTWLFVGIGLALVAAFAAWRILRRRRPRLPVPPAPAPFAAPPAGDELRPGPG